MRFSWCLVVITSGFLVKMPALHAQDATQSTVVVPSSPAPADEVAPAPSPSPATTPALPELSALDQAFKQTGLGQEADELRIRVQMRKLQNDVSSNPAVLAAKAAADAATTDLEKRERLREYYNITYGLMAQKASSSDLKGAIVEAKQLHIALLAQPRVRPVPGETPAPTPKKKKQKRAKRF